MQIQVLNCQVLPTHNNKRYPFHTEYNAEVADLPAVMATLELRHVSQRTDIGGSRGEVEGNDVNNNKAALGTEVIL